MYIGIAISEKRDVSTFDFTPVRLECGQAAAT
jgi:hypothetical protein